MSGTNSGFPQDPNQQPGPGAHDPYAGSEGNPTMGATGGATPPPQPYQQSGGASGAPSSGGQRFDAGQLGNDLQGDAKGLFGSLFDFSFTNYVTPKVVRIVYVIGIVLIALVWVIGVITAFTQSIWGGLLALLIGPIFALLYLIMFRILLEFYVAIVATAETVQKYAHRDGVR
ncbi:hypothetical protein GCM10025865_25020 [Paraoerskovia sediminicola]|uniref:DUF4282 domain-containing protein n=1 Tax=Paraoerskovia sediminicola TaxID=1138587 RepID=A0ABM8G4S3_9CELL|nr:DUF4282 domain-containing protein [Paraoerskovia sediminicola]BDZ43203.1 hypothetical protein GCM10025865_25020 [Paraoerskovia sediminicola]